MKKTTKAPRANDLGVITAASVKQAKAPKAAPKAKAQKAKPVEAPAPVAADPIEALFYEFIASDTRDDNYMRALLRKAYDAGKAAPRARSPRAGGPNKRELAADLLRRPEGCTTRDILDLTGWPAVSVPAVAKASGLVLTTAKDGRVTTYFGKDA